MEAEKVTESGTVSTCVRQPASNSNRVVITGIGLMASVGDDRESVWRGVRGGHSVVQRLTGLPGIPDGLLLGAPVDFDFEAADQLKVISLCNRTAEEALRDARIDADSCPRERFGCAISAHMGDSRGCADMFGMGHLYPPPRSRGGTSGCPTRPARGSAAATACTARDCATRRPAPAV